MFAFFDRLEFVVNDIDGILIAGNILLIHLFHHLATDNDVDMVFLWSVWYNVRLNTLHHARLLSTLKELITLCENGVSTDTCWKFGDKKTKTQVKEIWKFWLNAKWNETEVKKNQSKYLERFARGLGVSEFQSCFTARSIDYEMAVKDKIMKARADFRNELSFYPSCQNTIAMETIINPTIMRQDEIWCLHYRSDPSDSYFPIDM